MAYKEVALVENVILESIFNAKGDILSATAADTPALVTVSTNGFLLTANSSATAGIDWSNPFEASPANGTTTKGPNSDWAYDHAANAVAHMSNVIVIPFIIDGGGAAITTGQKGHIEIPFAATITAITLLADQAGNCIIDIWKDTYANFAPTDADSITNATPPTITGSNSKIQDTTLTNWTKTITAGDILAFNVDACNTIQRLTISIKATKT